jgi:hypothetical protein
MSRSDGLSFSCLPIGLPTCLHAFLLAFSPPFSLLTGPDSMIVRLALAAHSKLVGAMLDMGLQQGEAAFKQHISLQVRTTPCWVGRSTDWLVGDTVTLLRSVVFHP